MAKKATAKTKKTKTKIDSAEELVKAQQDAFNQYLAERKKTLEAELNTLGAKFNVLALELHAKGVSKLVASYRGEGDSGDIDYIHVDHAFGDYRLKPEDRDIVEQLAWKLLPSGFEINDGGEGEVIFDLVEKVIVVEHKARIVDYQSSTREIKFADAGKQERTYWC